MRVPLNWLKEYVKLPNSQTLLTDKLTMAGHLLDKVDKYGNETVIDLELRGNRADCYSILGVAREVSALFSTSVKYPEIYKKLKLVKKLKNCHNSINTPYVKRVMMVEITNVKICDSPKWLKDRLEAYGITSINNIVDLTNYIMIELGEPMHAFDLDKIGGEIEIRLARKNEQITTFQDDILTLSNDDLVWANKSGILSVAGAIGEKHRSISKDTTRVLLEAASYDRANIRRTIRRYNLLTEAGIRHEKELDPNLVEEALYRFLKILDDNKWGEIKPEIFDYYPHKVKPWLISLNLNRIKSLGGTEIKHGEVKKILSNLNFKIVKGKKGKLDVLCPTYRTDVRLEEDLIEEILRIYGYDRIPERILSLEIPPLITPKFIYQELELKNILEGLGFDEVISSSFVREKDKILNQRLGSDVSKSIVNVVNHISPDTEVMRKTLIPNLMNFTQKVIDERGEKTYFFEIGKIYYKDSGKYLEKRKLGVVYWDKEKENFAKFKGLIDALLIKANLQDTLFIETSNNLNETSNSYEIQIEKETVGYGGQIGDIQYIEIDLDSTLNKSSKPVAMLWPKYPPQIEDITLSFPAKTHIGNVVNLINKQDYISQVEITDNYQNYYTFRIWYQHPERTLTDIEVEKIRNKILQKIKEVFGGSLRN